MARLKRQKSNIYKKSSKQLREGGSLKVGFFDTKYPDGTPVAYVASIQEFGSPRNNIPPRSFMRTTAEEKASAWREGFKLAFSTVANGSEDIKSALSKMGFMIEGDIAQKITQITTPPLKPATIERKGSDKPLIETGLLLQSVTHQVEE